MNVTLTLYYILFDFESENGMILDAYPRGSVVDALAKLLLGSIETVTHLTGQAPTVIKLEYCGRHYTCGVSGNAAVLTDTQCDAHAIACEVNSLVKMGALIGTSLAMTFETRPAWARLTFAEEAVTSKLASIDSRVSGWVIGMDNQLVVPRNQNGGRMNMAIRGIVLGRLTKASQLVKAVDEDYVLLIIEVSGLMVSLVIRESKTMSSSAIASILNNLRHACDGLVIETSAQLDEPNYPITLRKNQVSNQPSLDPFQELSMLSGFRDNCRVLRVPQWLGLKND